MSLTEIICWGVVAGVVVLLLWHGASKERARQDADDVVKDEKRRRGL